LRARGGGGKDGPAETQDPGLFIELPLNNGVLLSGLLKNLPSFPLLPPPMGNLPLTIVPVKHMSKEDMACVPFDPGLGAKAAEVLMKHLSPGPLVPTSGTGRALRNMLGRSLDAFERAREYELMRGALASSSPQAVDHAEMLVLSIYARFQKCSQAPPRPAAIDCGIYDQYMSAFKGAAMAALEHTTSRNFQLIAKAHVLGLAQSASFPTLELKEARAMYSSAMRFGHALRQAETRFRADGAAGTFVPLPLEAQLLREELEQAWGRSEERAQRPQAPGAAATEGEDAAAALTLAAAAQASRPESDEDAARRSLQDSLKRLKSIGESRPGLATYLGWLGRFDPEALSILATPSPLVAEAMRMQVNAVWGNMGNSKRKVSTTPSDMIEALLFGAWLRDAALEAEDEMHGHVEVFEGRGLSGEDEA